MRTPFIPHPATLAGLCAALAILRPAPLAAQSSATAPERAASVAGRNGVVLHAPEGPGGCDGVEVPQGGRVPVTSRADSTVPVVEGGAVRPLVRGVASPADLGVGTRRGRIVVPLFTEDRVEIWTLPGGPR